VEDLISESTAKVNLRLEILRKREDGYHELRTLLQRISLADTLRFSLKKERGISIGVDHPDLPTRRRNLVHKAARSLLEKIDYKGGIHIQIEKRIPLGGGLGGGSSDAAATLKALNQLLGLHFSNRELMKIGLEIGADVPFFLFDGPAIASGIGERLKKIELPLLWYVLIYPDFEISTRWAYQNFVLTKGRFHFNFYQFLKSPEEISRILQNDLEEVVSKEYPEIEIMKGILSSVGALGTLMTGSGPTVFGIFPDDRAASEAYRRVKSRIGRRGWIVFKAHSVPC
jgi:4-diphosphocytidyl-2-C-methyl-D-erythritol kinase